MTSRTSSFMAPLIWSIAIWTLLYSLSKYFFWSASWDDLSLEKISWYLLLWSGIAYLAGGFLYIRFPRRILLLCGLILFLVAFIIGYYSQDNTPFISIMLFCIGFSYGLYVTAKNMMISEEIGIQWKEKSMKIWWIASITFILFIILWSILWAKLGESLSIGIPITILIIWYVLWRITTMLPSTSWPLQWPTLSKVYSDYKSIFRNWISVIIGLCIIWEASSEVSQVIIRYAVEQFHKSQSEATLLLIYSSVGAIIGNMASGYMSRWKEKWYTLFISLFAISLFLTGVILSSILWSWVYLYMGIFAWVIWLIFAAWVNLLESTFLAEIWSFENPSYIASLYGFLLWVIGAMIMFTSHYILNSPYWISGNSIFLWCLIILTIPIGYIFLKK